MLDFSIDSKSALFAMGAFCALFACAIAYFTQRKKQPAHGPQVVRKVPWYRPLPLAVKDGADAAHIVGKIYGPRLYVTRNVHHGWMVFADQQTKDNLSRCECCGSPTKN